MLQLTIRSPETEAGQSCSISGSSVTIGRNRLNDLCLGDGTVSDFHAEIVPDGHGAWKVNDHGSSNGTFLNGTKVKSKLIGIGNTIAFGGVETVVERAEVELDDDDDSVVPAVASEVSSVEEVSEKLLPYSSLPTAQIEQAIAMHHARISGKVATVPEPAEQKAEQKAKQPVAPVGEVAEMHDRLKHALGELQQLKDKHALQTRELESYQERSDLLEDPDADITKLRIQLSDLKRKCEEAERKLNKKDKEVVSLKKLAENHDAETDNDRISAADHEAAVQAAVEAAKDEAVVETSAADEKLYSKEIAKLRKQHCAEIRKLKKGQTETSKTKQKVQSEVKALEKRIEELTVESKKQQAEQEGKSDEVEKRDSQLAEKTNEAEQLEKRLAELQSTIENLQGDDATRSDEVARLSSEQEQQVALVQKREKELAELTALHESTAAKLREAEAKRDEIKTAGLQSVVELQDAKSTIKKHGKEEAKLQKRIAELEGQVEKSDEEVLVEKEKLRSDLERSGEKYAALKVQLAEGAENITQLKGSVVEHEAAAASKVATLSILQGELSEKEEAISAAEEKEAELRASTDENEATIEELRAEVETLSGKSGDATEQLSDSLLTIQGLSDELATLKREQGDAGVAGKIVEKLESEAEALRAGIEEVNQEREQMQGNLDQERIKLNREGVAIDAERVSLQATLKECESEVAAAGEKLKNVKQEVQAKRRELNTELEDLQSQEIIERQRLEQMTGKAEIAEQRAEKAAALVEETAQRWDKAEAGADKEERRLNGLQRKLLRRKKLLGKLKQIGRREQALKRKTAEAQALLQAADEHKPGKAALAVPRPWDVEKAAAEHETMLEKARELEESLAAKQAELGKIEQEAIAARMASRDEAEKVDMEMFSEAVARAEKLDSTVERLEVEKRSLIDTVGAMKAKIAAAGAGTLGSVVP